MPYVVTEVSSRFHCTGCHTGHNILLRTEIDDNCRKHCDQRCCECNIDICGIFAEEVELHQRKCTTVKLLADDHGDDEIIPGCQKGKDDRCHRDRLEQREHDIEEGLIAVAAVNRGGLLQGDRHVFDEAGVEEDVVSDVDAGLREAQTPQGIQCADRAQFLIERKHDRLERNQDDELKNVINGVVKFVILSCDDVGSGRTEQDDDDHHADGNDRTVFDGIKEVPDI